MLDIESDKLDHFSDEMIGLLALLAAQAAVALENAKLHITERRRMRQTEFVNLIARSAANVSELGLIEWKKRKKNRVERALNQDPFLTSHSTINPL